MLQSLQQMAHSVISAIRNFRWSDVDVDADADPAAAAVAMLIGTRRPTESVHHLGGPSADWS